MDKELKYILFFSGLVFLVFVAALPFFGRVALSMPSLLALCGFNVN
ncbi:MAG: hypothetical protein ISQ90_10960 [Rhodospirillales bacterium]|nr:hypothetical protein [Rhodospirillales bacterium]